MNTYAGILKQATTQTPQTQAVMGKDQVENSAGGFVFQISDMAVLNRFLILGSEGTYYAGKRDQTLQASKTLIKLIQENGPAVVRETVDVSVNGRAPKNDPAVFTLALCATYGDESTKKLAYQSITDVCRIGTHIFQFCDSVNSLRGWSAGLRNGVAKFYTGKTEDQVAYQMVKYRQRGGWEHRDVLRLAHPKAQSETLNNLLRWGVGKEVETLHPLVQAFTDVQKATTSKEVIRLINEHRLPWETLPTQFLADASVWEALLPHCPINALVRNLGRLSNLGLTGPMSDSLVLIHKALQDPKNLKKLHPLGVLVALNTYKEGHGDKGSLSWTPSPKIVSFLDEAFYGAFGAVEPIGKKVLSALDVSGSMGWYNIAGMPITPCIASAAMAMLRVRVEEEHYTMGFSNRLEKISLNSQMSLSEVMKTISQVSMGSTDCSLPMVWATENKIPVDVFEVYTDNETYAGRIHPFQALKNYRQKMGRDAKMVVYGMTSTGFSIADPSDPGMLDVVGFDTASPNVVSAWAK